MGFLVDWWIAMVGCGAGPGGSIFSSKRRQPSKLHHGKTHQDSLEDATPSDRCFIENGAALFEAVIASCRGDTNPVRMFSAKELAEATGNYDVGRFLGRGVWDVYGGVYDGRPIAVKRGFTDLLIDARGLFVMFLNEMVSLSQVNHRNVVRLLGCCIETQVPILVYELVSGSTLYHHLYGFDASRRRIPWKNRLQIALEVADALNYLHAALRAPIVHGNVQSSSIFLDDGFSVKVGSFGFSEVVRRQETHAEKSSSGIGSHASFGSEFELRPRITEKNDVFGFGLVLIELLTGEEHCETEYWNVDTETIPFVLAARQNMLGSVLDGSVLSEGDPNQLTGCAWVAIKCITGDLEGRPTMKEVVQELRHIRRTYQRTLLQADSRTMFLLSHSWSC